MRRKMKRKAIEEFKTELIKQEKSGATVDKYSRDVTRFFLWLPDDKEVTKEIAIKYKNDLTADYAPASVNSMLAALNSFFSFMGWKECAVKPLKIQRKIFCSREQELTREEYIRLVETAEKRGDERLALLLQLIASTGIRASEVQYITLEAARAGKAQISLKGKTRVILIPGKLRKKLLGYASKHKIISGQIMLTRNGKPLNRKVIWTLMKGLCEEAHVDSGKVFPHNLRHLFARVYYKTQKDIAKLADILGHSSINTTRIYLLSTGEEHMKSLDDLGLITAGCTAECRII